MSKRKQIDSDSEYVEHQPTSRRRTSQPQHSSASSSASVAAVVVEPDNPALNAISTIEECSDLVLHKDHEKRPIWITKCGTIILEAFSPIYAKAYDFLVAIADPVSRPKYIHKYKLSDDSLYAAVAIGLNTGMILDALATLCKTEVPIEVIEYIKEKTRKFGKAKLVLKDNKYHIESFDHEVLKQMLRHEKIREAEVRPESNPSAGFIEGFAPTEDTRNTGIVRMMVDDDDDDDEDLYLNQDGKSSVSAALRNYSFVIRSDAVTKVKELAKSDPTLFPLMEEYDFRNDNVNLDLPGEIRGITKIRAYQQKALTKMFGNGRARSGVIVLPCGAGKTLTGVSAMATIHKSCVILCINNTSVLQWKDQIVKWTSIPPDTIKLFSRQRKDALPTPVNGKVPACIVITTYSMLCHRRPSALSEAILDQIKSREWGLMLLDEVHVAPARIFREAVSRVNAHCKLGLTATLVREDGKEIDLNYLVGPKLYEANWIDLTEQGYLADVECREVWCPMTNIFYRKYMELCHSNDRTHRFERLLQAMNPRKMRTCQYLLQSHLGDKVLVFSDDVPVLKIYCESLGIKYIYGDTPENERILLLEQFRKNVINHLGLSRVGDIALDLPEANVLIQVTGQYGSNRQEAQRLGRILRPKADASNNKAYFYSLVSKNTKEMFYANKRQEYLINQGYTYRVDELVVDEAERSPKVTLIRTLEQECDLLSKLERTRCDKEDQAELRALRALESSDIEDDNNDDNDGDDHKQSTTAKRKSGGMSSFSGA